MSDGPIVEEHIKKLKKCKYVEYLGMKYELHDIYWSHVHIAYMVVVTERGGHSLRRTMLLTDQGVMLIEPGGMYKSPLYKVLMNES